MLAEVREMEKSLVSLDKGATCSAWNYCGQRLATGSIDGTLAVFESTDPSSSSFTCTSRTKIHDGSGVTKLVWVPPEYGDAVACILADGSLSLWEEVSEESGPLEWKLCKTFQGGSNRVLDVQFGGSAKSLKLVAAYSDGYVKIYELLDLLDLRKWQLQAEYQNVIGTVSKIGSCTCLSASISWKVQIGECRQESFVIAYNTDISQLNSAKVWEFDQDHQRWVPVAELALPEDKSNPVYSVAWAPNVGRPYEQIAVATQKGISIWNLGLNPEMDGRLGVEKVASLSGHNGLVWQMEWDMSGMTLASTGSDGAVRLWQSNLNGIWREQAILEPTAT
ncbi:protein SEH1 [Impatiens glandulifera]|uniref:protein SEH1 n=1 Tax=Impatiens glandulifera TaxID=253017 RepID=UPI001FB1717B|nr:protein SEH1 [Impatiens glandulifera]